MTIRTFEGPPKIPVVYKFLAVIPVSATNIVAALIGCILAVKDWLFFSLAIVVLVLTFLAELDDGSHDWLQKTLAIFAIAQFSGDRRCSNV